MMPTAERVRELFLYEPETGLLTRRVRVSMNTKIGCVAGTTNSHDGYVRVRVDGALYLAHRIVFLHVTGDWPKNSIDHMNGNRADNRWANLRDVTHSVNLQNQRNRSTSASGLIGAHKHKDRWSASIKVGGRLRHLGMFATPELAHAAYVSAKRQHHEGNTL